LANDGRGVFGRGFWLAMRHQRILWWVFAINLVLGGLGASSAARTLAQALHHSLAGQKLADGFDVGMLLGLAVQPEVRLFSHTGPSFLFAVIYLLFLLFVMPAIISVYYEDRRFTTGEFFAAAGAFFWAFVRLALWSLIPFVLVHLLWHGARELADYIDDRAVADQASFYILVLGFVLVLLLAIWARMWFDLAQVRSIALQDRAMRRNAVRMFGFARRRSRKLYWSYIGIGVLVWIVTILMVVIWTKVPPRAVPLTFLLLELIMLAQIFERLWQKACATTWYRLHPEPAPAAPEPVGFEPVLTAPYAGSPGTALDVDVPLSPEVEGAPDITTREPEGPKGPA